MKLFPLMPNLGAPLAAADIPMNTFNAGCVVFRGASVLDVFRVVNLPQIADSVIGPNVVNVVKKFRGMIPVHVEPCKSMGLVPNAAYFNVHVSASNPSGNVASVSNPVPGTCAPAKNSRLRVVVKKFAQTLRGKIGLSHAVVPLKQWFGQRPACVGSTCGLRYFNL